MLFKALAALAWGAGISLFSGIVHVGVDDVRSDLTDARSHLQSPRDILTNGTIRRVFQNATTGKYSPSDRRSHQIDPWTWHPNRHRCSRRTARARIEGACRERGFLPAAPSLRVHFQHALEKAREPPQTSRVLKRGEPHLPVKAWLVRNVPAAGGAPRHRACSGIRIRAK